jgi:bis(5'-nucleosyl)-tetraphosphatase (symmetrical)
MRWVVGDLQGCVREFEALLRTVRFDPARDELWSAGDLVNRGPESLETLRLWADVGGRGVIGNHDVHALLHRSGRRAKPMPDLDALFAAPDADALLARVRALPALVHLPAPAEGAEGEDAWLVHAGIHPAWLDLHAVARRIDAPPHDDAWLESDDVAFATRVRCCTPAGKMMRHTGAPDGCPDGSMPWDALYRGDTLVVHGHWAMRGHYRGRRTLGLDSGCVYGGPLTAWCQDEDRVVQIPAMSR